MNSIASAQRINSTSSVQRMNSTAWAIAYDLDVKGMKIAGYSKSRVTQFYSQVRKCLQDNHFEKMNQLSIYTCDKDNSIADAFFVVTALQQIPDTDKFIKRLNLFRVEDFNDLLPLVAQGKSSAADDKIEIEIEEVFGSEDDMTV